MESFGAGAKEEHRPPIEAATIGWCRTHLRREWHKCDRIAGRSGAAHGYEVHELEEMETAMAPLS